MVIDSSVLLALLFRKTGADRFIKAIADADIRLVGAPSMLEATMVAVGRLGPTGRDKVEHLLGDIGATIAPFPEERAR